MDIAIGIYMITNTISVVVIISLQDGDIKGHIILGLGIVMII